MVNLETLYSIDTRDKVRHWSIFVNGDSYHTESGLVGSEYKVTKTKPKLSLIHISEPTRPY